MFQCFDYFVEDRSTVEEGLPELVAVTASNIIVGDVGKTYFCFKCGKDFVFAGGELVCIVCGDNFVAESDSIDQEEVGFFFMWFFFGGGALLICSSEPQNKTAKDAKGTVFPCVRELIGASTFTLYTHTRPIAQKGIACKETED